MQRRLQRNKAETHAPTAFRRFCAVRNSRVLNSTNMESTTRNPKSHTNSLRLCRAINGKQHRATADVETASMLQTPLQAGKPATG
jgi:hypothetical protein